MSEPGPETDHRHRADVVTEMVDHVLELAMTCTVATERPSGVYVAGSRPYADSVGSL
jgi:hypothetical protein